jgi:hypothetical protein
VFRRECGRDFQASVRLRSPAKILEDLRQEVIAMGLLPAPIEAEPVDKRICTVARSDLGKDR